MVRSINWNVQVGTYDEAIKINEEISELNSTIGNTLDEVSDEFQTNDTIFFDQIVVDLGSIDHSDLNEKLRLKFRDALYQKLHDNKSRIDLSLSVKENRHSNDEPQSEISSESLVLYFLKNGSLPWWAEEYDFETISEQLSELVKSSNQYFEQTLAEVLRNEKAAFRLVHQFEENVSVEVLANLMKVDPKDLKCHLEAIMFLISSNKKKQSVIKDEILIELAMQASATNSDDELINLMAAVALKGSNKTLIPDEKLIQELPLQAEQRIFLDKVVLKMNDLRKNESKEIYKKEGYALNRPFETIEDDSANQLMTYSAEQQEAQDFFIKNSGLVILWPYLQEFFRSLNLVVDGTFINDEARVKAVHLLQFLGEGIQEQPEYRLMLNKLLCGIDLEVPIPRKFKLAKSEENACLELLEAVIQNWGALKNTSVEGLQASFLTREGKLGKGNHGWTLVVESKAYDLLLDKMPWSISIVKLPWMNEPLYVEWT